jgi:spore coat protein A
MADMFTRRDFIRIGTSASLGLVFVGRVAGQLFEIPVARALAVDPLDPTQVSQFVTPLLVPPVMPQIGTIRSSAGPIDVYEISVRQFEQQVLPAGLPKTLVWGYGPVTSDHRRAALIHNAPSLTIEAKWNRPTRITWVNDLVDAHGEYLPHLLPVDPTLHWANPLGGVGGRDMRPTFTSDPGRYVGPVPLVTHVHGAVGVGDESDGYAEAWYLPAATNLPADCATEGTWYDFFAGKASERYGVDWAPGSATFQYPNPDRASTNWYHDHTLGMTRLNVYAGPAGFYIIRGGPDDAVVDARTGGPAELPGPAPKENDKFPPNKTYYEIPIAIQDRSFNADGSLFYPDTREFFDGIVEPYVPDGEFSPIWNPEFFGNTIMVNGATWPFHTVEQRRYRFRFLNGCQSRFLILDFSGITGVDVWQIGNEGGFLASPVDVTGDHGNRLVMGLAERADVIVDFTNVPLGSFVLQNIGPDEPFGGGEPGHDFPIADPETTGRIMRFDVVPAAGPDPSTPPEFLALPPILALPPETVTRRLALIEMMGHGHDADGEEVEGPVEALLGTLDEHGMPVEQLWMDPVSENPAVGATEVWEFYNTTGDAHPMHVHEVVFEVVGREGLVTDGDDLALPLQLDGLARGPEPWETGFKDTVIAYPLEVTRVRATFANPGQFVWHCHIVEHEDNEMMRPFRIGPVQPGQPA